MSDETKKLECLPLYPQCTMAGCTGTIEFADMSEVYGGEEAFCDTCGCPHVAVEFPGEMRVQASDNEQEQAQ